MNRQGGYTLIEVGCAFAVLGLLATTAYVGEAGELRSVARSFAETAAAQAASGRLEQLAARPAQVRTGERAFPVDLERLPDARGVERVRAVEPGLLEVAVEVQWGGGTVQLTTLLARSEGQ